MWRLPWPRRGSTPPGIWHGTPHLGARWHIDGDTYAAVPGEHIPGSSTTGTWHIT